MNAHLGPAGRFAKAFVHSPLTPLFMAASIALGMLAVAKLPREEEPQIKVPMVDVMVALPGASAKEVEQRVTKPMEKLLWEIPGVEYLYSTSSPGQTLVVVRFQVGEDEERSLVKLNQKLQSNVDLMPPGASLPLVKPRSIDDVPVLALTLHSGRYGAFELRRIAAQLHDEISRVPGVSQVAVIGGQRREIRVTLDPLRLEGHGLAPLEVWRALGENNQRLPAGVSTRAGRESIIESGGLLRTAEDVGAVVVTARGGRAVFVRDVAEVTNQGAEPADYVSFHTRQGVQPAVTLAVSKRKALNAIDVSDNVLQRVEAARSRLLPADVELSITRHYGETAAEKSNELLQHMALAVVSVSLLVALVLGFRESLVVFAAIPVTLALTLTMFYLTGYTLNRITLFALIFSIGILVDDAIVVVENIVRHARLLVNRGRALAEVAVEAVAEVGNPTILATLAVVAAILPMAFVGGMMGPYMLPIPVGATAAMVFSLLVAFMVTPWAAVRLLAGHDGHADHETEDRLTRFYRRFMAGVLAHPVRIALFLSGVVVLLALAMVLVPTGFVKVKMLPFDNKNEFQVIIDLPEGTPLEETRRVAVELAGAALAQPEVVNAQAYAGAASPYNFNGLVRHYYLRQGSNVADIQVNLRGKAERDQQSHEIAKQVRQRLLPLARQSGARIKVAEVPPGPPVLQTLVAEIYGPTGEGQRQVAGEVRRILESTAGVVDTDWYVEDPQRKLDLQIDQEKAALHGITATTVARTLRLATSGEVAGSLHAELEQETVPINLRFGRAARADVSRLQSLKIAGQDGRLVALSEITRVVEATEAPFIYHKNLMPVTYVTADVAGTIESPVYAILKVGSEIEKYRPHGYEIIQFVARQPADEARYALKWDGEWQITYEVFRDLGLAFAAVLVLIYVLVVGWFGSFVTPLVIMAAIPFSLVGILPAHGLMGAFFTATSMIGFIAGAGIVVRNSIILVDFIELRLQEGMPLAEAVVDAGAVRFRPMLLTAAAVAVGAAVILFDPIFQGLAISLMAGEIASLALSRLTVPILYYVVANRRSMS